MEKRKFLFKATLVGLFGAVLIPHDYAHLATDSLGVGVSLWVTLLNFGEYFKLLLLLWLVFDNYLRVKNWLLVGLLSSVIYTLSVLFILGVIAPEPSQIMVFLERLISGGVSAIPIWLILRHHFAKSYLWLGVYGFAYACFRILATVISFIYNISFINDFLSHSYVIQQIVLDGIAGLQYALFGLLFGICLDIILKSSLSIELPLRESE
jgi:hypothetical protein